MSSCQTESLEEAGSALSDEHSTMSSAYQSDPLLGAVQGTVRKAGRLAVKNFLVHKKSKKVESAARRKWKSYWVSLKGGLGVKVVVELKVEEGHSLSGSSRDEEQQRHVQMSSDVQTSSLPNFTN